MAQLLVIDDEPSICWGLEKLAKRLGHGCATAGSAEQGIDLASRWKADAVLVDVRLPGLDGLDAMGQLRTLLGEVPIIVMTAYGDLGTAVEAVRRGAFEYVVKPFDLAQIERVINRALDSRREPPLSEAITSATSIDGLIGRSTAMQEVFKRIAFAAASDACVLLQGESGTGKEVVARAMHRYSKRAAGPFLAVNVAALSDALAESELFGHVRGAFTGADAPRRGLLEQASGGTLFLDEVADIPLAAQVKLLRALEQNEVTPVGSNLPVPTNFRLISASHQDLAAKVREGRFRHDLYYRICTFLIDLPPLRERDNDICDLANYFIAKFAPEHHTKLRLSTESHAELKRRPWHGNVRELRNAIEHAILVARDGLVMPEHLPIAMRNVLPGSEATSDINSLEEQLQAALRRWTTQRLQSEEVPTALYDEFLSIVEPPLLNMALEAHRGQCASAARTLGIHRTTLRKKIDQYGIEGRD